MKRTIWLGLLVSLALAGTAQAATISLSASGAGVVSITVAVEGVEALAEPSLGAYDLDLAFDDAVLAFDRVDFGSFLGGPDDSFQDASAAGGVVDFAEVSLIFPNFDLQQLQPDDFVLATVVFEVIAPEDTLTSVAITQALLSDGNASRIPIDPLPVLEFEAVIPEVSGAHVFGVGLLVALLGHRLRSGTGVDPRREP